MSDLRVVSMTALVAEKRYTTYTVLYIAESSVPISRLTSVLCTRVD